MVTVIGAILILYCLLVLAAAVALGRAFKPQDLPAAVPVRRISVIIPFRNESAALPSLLAGLARQDHPADAVEFIFVDDHSTDDSAAMVAASGPPGLKLLTLPEGAFGKKRAITLGVDAATGELVVFTDADCHHPPGWLSEVNRTFSSDQVRMAIGLVRMLPYGWQSLEFSALSAITAVTTMIGRPLFCNGANLACRRADFLQAGGYEGNLHIASGDDEFLMRKFHRLFPQGIQMIRRLEGVVTTAPQPDILSFLRQRVRWAGKWKHNTDRLARVVAVLVLLVQVVSISAFISLIAGGNVMVAIPLLARFVAEGWFLYRISRRLAIPFRIGVFLNALLLYPFYVVATGLFSLFLKPDWKGRVATT